MSSRKTLVVMLAVGLMQAAAYWWAGSDARGEAGFALTQPDTFFYCQAARRIVEGHPFSFSPGTAVSSGTTSVLYPFVLAVPYALGATGDSLLTAGFVLNAVFYLLYLCGWWVVIRRKLGERPAALAAGLLIAGIGQVAYVVFDHSDIGFFLAFSAWFAAAMATENQRGIIAGLIIGPWIRPEGMILDVAYMLVMWRGLVPALLSMGGVFALNFALTGDWQFSSVAQKGYFKTMPFWEAAGRFFVDLWDLVRIFLLGLGFREHAVSRGWYFPPVLCAALMWIGIATHRWRTRAARMEFAWLVAMGGSFATVASSGWIGTNYDRYLAWVVPGILLFATFGGEYVAHRIRVRVWGWIPLTLLVTFVLLAAPVTVAFFRLGALAVDERRKFMVRCEQAMEPGASVGMMCECTAAYEFPGRHIGCLAGVYSPEFTTPLGTSPLEILKQQPATRFDYWFEEGGIAGQLPTEDIARLGTVVITNDYGLALYRADWRAFDAARKAPEVPGLKLVDSLDVAYAPDERRTAFRVTARARAHVRPFFRVMPDGEGTVIADSGVFVRKGMEFSAQLQPDRPATVVMRVCAQWADLKLAGFTVEKSDERRLPELKLGLKVNDLDCGEIRQPLPESGFANVRFEIPASAIRTRPTRVALSGECSVSAFWFYQ